MTPNPGPVVEPELKEVDKVESKPSGPRDQLQNLVRPVLTTGCSQQDFGFFREEWR